MSASSAPKRYKTFDEINTKLSPEAKQRVRAEALVEIERMGYGALRRARKLTQTDIAEKLQISQPSVAALEQRADIMLSTLAKYIEALGGQLEINAVFPEATFNLAAPARVFSVIESREEVKTTRRKSASVAICLGVLRRLLVVTLENP